MSMSVLDRKVLRDLARMWAQVFAIALVMACGVMTIVLAVGAYRSLLETRTAYYDRYRFAHVFAQAVRAPLHLKNQVSAIEGIAAVELRIVEPAILDIPGMDIPASGVAISIPSSGEPAVNRLYLRSGRLPQAGHVREIAVDERFAKAHGFKPGDSFSAVLNGRKLNLSITAIVLSPEFIYAIGPGDMVPDDKRFAVFFMPGEVLAGLFDMNGAFNDVAIRLQRGASQDDVIARIDRLLRPYGGRGAYTRAEQTSNAFIDAELTQLNAMARIIPPVFLFVSAFLVNMILSRLISLEREQIGLLKANGYSSLAVAWHYAKLVIVIALLGLAMGGISGSYFGRGLTRLYAEFFSFPFLIFRQSPDLYLIAAGVSVTAALGGAAKAIWSVVQLPPAVAMRPPAPARYRSVFSHRGLMSRIFTQIPVMALRHLIHRPVRSFLTTLGVAFSVAMLITALFSTDSIDEMIDTVFFRAERADARLSFARDVEPGVISAVRRLPGVIGAETFRSVPVILRHGHLKKRAAITGRQVEGRLSRVLDKDGNPVAIPEHGLVLADRLARQLDVKPGEKLEVELIENGNRIVEVTLAGVVTSYIGLGAHMQIDALNRLVGIGPRVNGAWIDVDTARLGAFHTALKGSSAALAGRWPPTGYDFVSVGPLGFGFLYPAIKQTPSIGTIALQSVSREKFRETIEENIVIMTTVYVAIAVIVAFGVVYNSARIQLSERARELASLRVLGFTRGEVSQVLLIELLVIALVSQPLGWVIGYGFAWAVVAGFESDLYSIPFVVNPRTFAFASLVVLSAAAASALIVRRRVDRLDLIRVLKTRE